MTASRGIRPAWSSFRSVRGEALSQDDVAALFGVTRQAVQQAEHSGLEKLRSLCVARGLAPGSMLVGWPCGVEPLVGRYLGSPARRDAKGRRTKGPGVGSPGTRQASPKEMKRHPPPAQ